MKLIPIPEIVGNEKLVRTAIRLYRELTEYHLFTVGAQTDQQLWQSMTAPGSYFFLAVGDADVTGTVFGLAAATNWQPVERSIQGHIIVDRSHRRDHIGLGMGHKLLDWVRENLNIRRAQCFTLETNVAVHKILEAVGFKLEGTLRKARFKEGRYIDARVYGYLFED